MASKKPKLLIIDGNALIHRSFHALPPTMATREGEPTNAVYGFTMVLLKSIKDIKPEYVVLTLDKKSPTFRHKAYDKYKANRVAAPKELYMQIPRVKEVAGGFGIPIYEMAGYEADDLIGTIAAKVDGRVEKIIVTGDLDTLQLVNAHTKVYTMSHGLSDSVIYDPKKVRERFLGLGPEKMVDYKALRGDPSDNIPGVPGIGEKTAIELIQNFGSLDGVYKYLDQLKAKNAGEKIKPRIAELLIAHKSQAYLSQKLSRIECAAKISFDLDSARFGDFNREKLVKLFNELEFKSLLPKIRELAASHTIAREKKSSSEKGAAIAGGFADKYERNKKLFKYQLVDNEKSLQKFLKELKKQKIFAVDTETSGWDTPGSLLLGISFSWKKDEAYFLLIQSENKNKAKAHNLDLFSSNAANSCEDDSSKRGLPLATAVSGLKKIFSDPKVKKVGHNIKFDYKVLKMHGLPMKGVFFDTMIASYLLNPGSRAHGLDALSFSELGHEKISKTDLLGEGKNKITFSQVPAENLSLYSCEDADFTFRLFEKLKNGLSEHGQNKLFHDIEMPLVTILGDMELAGVKIDAKFLADMEVRLRIEITRLEKTIWKLSGKEFNVNSTQQLKEVLFNGIGISTAGVGRTKTGFSTSADELYRLRDAHPVIRQVMEYRELAKLQNTYVSALPKLINAQTGRVHTSFNQSVTSTGRLSSTDPNLQNIPIRTELGREIRKAFIAERGFRLISADYSQIELRLAAHMSGDKKMIKAFREGRDIHIATAAEINQVEIDQVTSEMRREAKAVNFGIIYGQGARGLSESADIPYDRARQFIDQYFSIYSDIKKFVDQCIEDARASGYAETIFGRKRLLPEINSSAIMFKKAAERMAINTPLQGTAADMIKIAMINIARIIDDKGRDEIRLLLQIHDELLFEVREDKIQKWAGIIKKTMEEVIKLKVPVIADISAGKSWGEMVKLNK